MSVTLRTSGLVLSLCSETAKLGQFVTKQLARSSIGTQEMHLLYLVPGLCGRAGTACISHVAVLPAPLQSTGRRTVPSAPAQLVTKSQQSAVQQEGEHGRDQLDLSEATGPG